MTRETSSRPAESRRRRGKRPERTGAALPAPGKTAPALVVTFLGTGSGTPSLSRNLASVAVQRGGELFLFDCGEAAQIQYRRAGLSWGGLRGIAISHLHGDHVTGLMGLLMSLHLADRREPLEVWGPPGVADYIRSNQRLLRTRFAYRLDIRESSQAGCLLETDEYLMRAAPLDHRVECLGFRLEERVRPGRFQLQRAADLGVPPGPFFGRLQAGETVVLDDGRTVLPEEVLGEPRPGVSLAYCTDTRPCDGAIDLASGVDLLIHEATFDSSMQKEAHERGHSTAADAARIALAAGAEALVMTHISPRYAHVEGMLAEARAIFSAVDVASDLSRFEIYHREESR